MQQAPARYVAGGVDGVGLAVLRSIGARAVGHGRGGYRCGRRRCRVQARNRGSGQARRSGRVGARTCAPAPRRRRRPLERGGACPGAPRGQRAGHVDPDCAVGPDGRAAGGRGRNRRRPHRHRLDQVRRRDRRLAPRRAPGLGQRRARAGARLARPRGDGRRRARRRDGIGPRYRRRSRAGDGREACAGPAPGRRDAPLSDRADRRRAGGDDRATAPSSTATWHRASCSSWPRTASARAPS